MYDANLSYEENYTNGPFARLTPENKFPKIKYTQKPQYEFLGIPLHIPFGVAAGPLLNSKFIQVALESGFCFPIYKTVRSQFWKCYNWPNVLALHAENKSLFANNKNKVTATPMSEKDYLQKNFSISNSFGAPSQKPEVWAKDFLNLLPYSKAPGHHVALSFQASKIDSANSKEQFYEDAKVACQLACEAVVQSGFCVLEVNLSCPNEKHLPIYKDVPSALKLLSAVHSAVKNHPQIKLIAKIGTLNQEEVHIFLSEAGQYIHAVSAINTISAEIVTQNGQIALGSQSLTGGVCGRLIFEQGVQMTSLLAQEREKIGLNKKTLGIVGVGGVMNKEDFQTYKNAGADLVQSVTGMMWNLNLAQEIASHLNVPFHLEN